MRAWKNERLFVFPFFHFSFFELKHFFLFNQFFNIAPKRPPKQFKQLVNGVTNPMFGVQPPPSVVQEPPAPLQTCNLSQIMSAQHQMNASALFSSNPPQYIINAQQLQAVAAESSPARHRRPLNLLSFEGIELVHHNANRELHQAEKIVENAEQQQKTAFRFDTITPKRPLEASTSTVDETEENGELKLEGKIASSAPKPLSFLFLSIYLFFLPSFLEKEGDNEKERI